MSQEKTVFLTVDTEMRKVLAIADNVASSRATVLLCGESGCGKEMLAQYIHRKSPRAHRKLVALNCAAIPEGLLESELFGFEKGSFTGAHASKQGKFELAHESTLLLDEISEMPLLLQTKLLRVIQEGEIERVGGKAPIKVNVRLIATSNRDLKSMVRQGLFREDLFYRLNVIPITIPPLRQRLKDIDVLSRLFVDRACERNELTEKNLTAEALQKLKAWSWPGNVRELENVLERSVLMATQNEIGASDILINDHGDFVQANTNSAISPGMSLSEAERLLILKTLELTEQNRAQAARVLGISVRTLRNKLHEYGVMGGPNE